MSNFSKYVKLIYRVSEKINKCEMCKKEINFYSKRYFQKLTYLATAISAPLIPPFTAIPNPNHPPGLPLSWRPMITSSPETFQYTS